jgi:hypothetical protein
MVAVSTLLTFLLFLIELVMSGHSLGAGVAGLLALVSFSTFP